MVMEMKENTNNIETKNKVIEVIDELRPFLMNDGGNIEFIKLENNIVYVKLAGACLNCSMIDITLKDTIERIIIDKIPEIKEVQLVND